MNDELAKSIAVQDQEWAEARDWFTDPGNASAAAALTVASIAKDANFLTKLMQSDERYAEIVQRCLCLAIVEVLNRHTEARPA